MENKIDYDIVIVDYPNVLGNSFQFFDKERSDKITEMGREVLKFTTENMLLKYYNITIPVLKKFIEIYGKNPTESWVYYFPNENKDIERDKQRLMDITRALKINKLRNVPR